MADIPTTRYVKSDDVHVAYQVIGDGPVDVLWVPGFVSHMEAGWQNPQGAALLRRLSSFCRLILFDKRGTGCPIAARRFLRSNSACMTCR